MVKSQLQSIVYTCVDNKSVGYLMSLIYTKMYILANDFLHILQFNNF